MPHWRSILISAFGFAALAAAPANAQFPACNQAYIDTFAVPAIGDEPAWSPGDAECVEYFRFTISTPRGERVIRGVGDINVDTLLTRGAIAAVRDGARRATERFSGLGDYAIDHVTILITGSRSVALSVQRKWGSAAGWTLPGPDPAARECRITTFLFDNYNHGEIHYIVAHELFHCVELASVTDAQFTAAGALWWIEGAAELFAAYAVGEQGRWAHGADFDRAVVNHRPLYAMTYEAAVFFYWLYSERGLGGLIPFLRGMASTGTDSAHRAALRRLVSDEAFLRFAQAYDDRTIAYPSGRPADFGPQVDGATWRLTRTAERERPLKPFVVDVGWTDYGCSNWRNTLDEANVAARNVRGPTWSDWPSEIDARETGAERLRSVAFHTGDSNGRLRLRAQVLASCAPCMERTEIDRCLIGDWLLTAGGPMEWMRAQGLPFTRAERSDYRMSLLEDGTFFASGHNFDFQLTYPGRDGPRIGEGRAQVAPTFGRWAASRGKLYGCIDGGGSAAGSARVTSPRGTGVSPWSGGDIGGAQGSSDYTCNDTTFTTRAAMPRGGDMTHEFTRQSPRVP